MFVEGVSILIFYSARSQKVVCKPRRTCTVIQIQVILFILFLAIITLCLVQNNTAILRAAAIKTEINTENSNTMSSHRIAMQTVFTTYLHMFILIQFFYLHTGWTDKTKKLYTSTTTDYKILQIYAKNDKVISAQPGFLKALIILSMIWHNYYPQNIVIDTLAYPGSNFIFCLFLLANLWHSRLQINKETILNFIIFRLYAWKYGKYPTE